jgi:hypothetical protein
MHNVKIVLFRKKAVRFLAVYSLTKIEKQAVIKGHAYADFSLKFWRAVD